MARSWSSAPDRPGCRSPTSCCEPDGSVYLSVGPHDRPPRRYRGRDFVWWLGVLGKWDADAPPQGAEHVTIAVSGAHGGHTVDFRDLAAQRHESSLASPTAFERRHDPICPRSAREHRGGDANYLALLDEADAFIARIGLDLPEEPEARELGPLPSCATDLSSNSISPRPA